MDVLADPVRRRLVELLADGETSVGALAEPVRAEFGISQPAVSQHLRVLRDAGLVSVRAEGNRRLYAIVPDRLAEVDHWIARFRDFWSQRLDALGTELVRGRRRQGRGHRHDPPRDDPREESA